MRAGAGLKSTLLGKDSAEQPTARLSSLSASSSEEGVLENIESLLHGVSQRTRGLLKCSKIIIAFFTFVAVLSLVSLILGFLLSSVLSTDIFFFVILGANFVAAMTGAVGVYRWGVVQEQIQAFDAENSRYEKAMTELRKTEEELHEVVSKANGDLEEMQRETTSIRKQLAAFEDLRKSLLRSAGSEETIDDLIDDLNQTFADARVLERVNKRASLLRVYYDCSFWRGGDRSEGLTRREYERMLQKLTAEDRAAVVQLTDFETLAGVDSIVDISEFQGLIEKLLAAVE